VTAPVAPIDLAFLSLKADGFARLMPDALSMNSPATPAPTRRRFLLGTAGACAAVGTGVWQFLPSRPSSGKWELVRRTSFALGSAVAMSVWHRDSASGEAALDAAFAELEQVENVMSLYRPDSQISRLNRDSVLRQPHPYLVTVLEFASRIAAQTSGAFDVTVQPLWNLYQGAKQQGRLPEQPQVVEACGRVDWRRVQISAERISLSGDGTAITLNGIAQGFAADVAMAALRRAGVTHALIDTGEMGSISGKPDGSPWRVGIQHPRQPGAFVSLANLEDRCLATSGDYETWFSADFVNNHLFDPRTGHSPTELSSVSIAAPTGLAADALSTAVFVLGVERGMNLVRSIPGTDALFVAKDGSITKTEGFPVAT
jgi:thiamine biosynthesis lipoprotein